MHLGCLEFIYVFSYPFRKYLLEAQFIQDTVLR